MLEYNLDISKESLWISITADDIAKTFPFYITEIGRFFAGKDYYTKRSSKAGLFLMYTISGEGTLSWKNSECILTKNTAVVIRCDELHCYMTTSKKEPWDFLWLHFDGTGFQAYESSLINTLTPVYIDSSIANRIVNVMEGANVQDLSLYARASDAVSSILTTMLLENIKSNSADPIDSALKYIHNNYSESINLDELAGIVNLSKFYLVRLFKTRLGISPYNYILKYRINQSKHLLRTTTLSIEEIGIMVGFSSASNYIHRFKILTKETPYDYRKDTMRF